VPIPAEKLVLVEALAANNGTASLTTMELRPGQKVKLRIRVRMNGRKKIRDVVGGFPVLVEGGAKHIVGEPKPLLAQRHPRTALCTNEQKIIFVVVDGRQPQLSVGMTLDELADLMVGVGCTTAMNTDGGGSSVMAVREESATSRTLQIVNSPSDGQERGRGNAWIVVKR
jgi:exopolysaccharide biosynthesis protein